MTARTFLTSALAVLVALSAAAVPAAAHQAAGVAGVWKLNEAESNNPNGAAGRGAGAQQVSQLTAEETARINRMLSALNKAAQTLEIVVEGNDMTIKQDGSGFPKQSADGKKAPLANAQLGKIEIKIKVDAKGMTREVTTQDDLKVVETYALSADGKQLTVTVKPSQPVMKIEDAKIKRVYYRQ
jgi:hypothetical protein